MSDSPAHSSTQSVQDPKHTAQRILGLVTQLAQELQPSQHTTNVIHLDSKLDHELGFDSLTRAELLQRTAQCFTLNLSDQSLARIDTPRDLLNEVLAAQQVPIDLQDTVGEISLDTVDATPDHVMTLQELLDWHVDHHPTRPHLYVYQNANETQTISYQRLRDKAQNVAKGLISHGIEPGDTVAIMLPTSNDYFYCFFGILYARAIPVPIYPPARLSQLEDHLQRHAKILQNAEAKLLITVTEAKPLSHLLRLQVPSMSSVVTFNELHQHNTPVYVGNAATNDIAFLQYTSGSTGVPKGVMLTHANLLANIRAMGKAVRASPDDVFISWLPVYHDMGLIGAWLGSLYHAMPLVIMSPLAFLSQPHRWLWAIHRHNGTLSPAPNFAYELCLNKIADSDLEGLDLNRWRLSWNGAEPISPQTMARFTARFSQYGFRPETMSPVYGLAESSVGLTFPAHSRPPRIETVQRKVMMRSGTAVAARDGEADTLQLVGLGLPLLGHQIRIVDALGNELPERQEGELEFKGPSSTSGYYHDPQKTTELYHDGWLKTGDRALTMEGELFLTGRIKDIIIKAGRNIYPHELEAAISQLPDVRKGCIAAIAADNPQTGTEQLVVLAESKLINTDEQQQLRQQIQDLAINLLGIPVDDIVICPAHTVPKTSSGKIRRSACKTLYQDHNLNASQRPVWQQTLRMAIAGVRPSLYRFTQLLRDFFFATYMWLIMALLAPLVWCLVAFIPTRHQCWKVTRWGARTLIRLTGIPLTITGKHNLPAKGDEPFIIVANHASYLDGLVLVAATELEHQFVAKAELKANPFARIFLTKLGSHFVDRFDTQQSLKDTENLSASAQSHSPLTLFPEGTLYRMAGIHAFHMGAFQIAAQHTLPILPVTLRGTRSILRDKSLFPRRGHIDVIISKPVMPNGNDWNAALALRAQVRSEILTCSKEPDLAQENTR
ncbi:AMP-binding protein [Photobacterium makurazakiensis]|uniref:AMP-binding protein n=1 Tax=Photobacterium makurazakiensis TaxID=2910234 RepID=UPI003D0EEBD3